MPIENDIQAGLDPSSLATVTQAQLLQMINQAVPISNKGMILCFDGNAAGAAGIGFPDVTTNPKYIRYLWLDTQVRALPVLKRYTGTYAGTPANPSAMSNLYTDWTAGTNLGSEDVKTIMISLASATGGIWLGQLKRAADGSVDHSKALNIVILDGNGQYCSSINMYDLYTAFNMFVYNLSVSGAGPGKFVKYYSVGNYAKWDYIDPTNDIKASLGNQIPPASLSPGTNGQVLSTVSGAVAWSTAGGSGLREVVYAPGTVLASGTTYIEYSDTGGYPKVVRMVLAKVLAGTDAGYDSSVGDEIALESVLQSFTGAGGTFAGIPVIYYRNGANYVVRISWMTGGGSFYVLHRDRTPIQTLTKATWAPKMYLYY